MSFSFVATMMLIGSSAVIAFVLLPSEEELQAPANAPVSHHRSVPEADLKNKRSSDILLGNEGFCMFKHPEDPDRIAYHILLILITGLLTGVTARFS